MTLSETKAYALKGDLISISRYKSTGTTTQQMVDMVLDYAQGEELDLIISNCLALFRRQFTNPLNSNIVYAETDVDYRNRAKARSHELNIYDLDSYNTTISNNTNKSICLHNWSVYSGLFETFEFCKRCGERKE